MQEDISLSMIKINDEEECDALEKDKKKDV